MEFIKKHLHNNGIVFNEYEVPGGKLFQCETTGHQSFIPNQKEVKPSIQITQKNIDQELLNNTIKHIYTQREFMRANRALFNLSDKDISWFDGIIGTLERIQKIDR